MGGSEGVTTSAVQDWLPTRAGQDRMGRSVGLQEHGDDRWILGFRGGGIATKDYLGVLWVFESELSIIMSSTYA